jgi:hypothetical protein
VRGSLGTMAVLLFETAFGGLALLWASPLWGTVRAGFFKLAGAVIVACAALAWASARAALDAPASAGDAEAAGAAVTALGVFALATLVWQVLLYLRAAAAARWVGIAALLPALAAAGLLAQASGRLLIGGAALLTGALFLGACVDGLLLGHWYLVDRRLSNRPIGALAGWLIAGVGAALVSAVLGGDRGDPLSQSLSPLLAVPNLTVYLALGFVAVVALLAWFIRALVRGGSIQAATGMFYLAVIMAVAAEFSAKVFFFR